MTLHPYSHTGCLAGLQTCQTHTCPRTLHWLLSQFLPQASPSLPNAYNWSSAHPPLQHSHALYLLCFLPKAFPQAKTGVGCHYRASSRPMDRTCISCLSCTARQILYPCATWEVPAWWFTTTKWSLPIRLDELLVIEPAYYCSSYSLAYLLQLQPLRAYSRICLKESFLSSIDVPLFSNKFTLTSFTMYA